MRRPPTPSATPARPRRRPVGGAPPVLPAWADALSDRWWGASPRTRATAVAVSVASIVAGLALQLTLSPHGPPAAALVAAGDLPAGTTLDPSLLREVRWPADLLPADRRLRPEGMLTAPLPAGAVLTDAHVTDAGLGGLVGAGRSAVPLPVELVPDLPAGTSVQVVGTDVDGSGAVLAADALVVAADGTSLWLAVPASAAADVAAAGLRGAVTLAVLAGPSEVD